MFVCCQMEPVLKKPKKERKSKNAINEKPALNFEVFLEQEKITLGNKFPEKNFDDVAKPFLKLLNSSNHEKLIELWNQEINGICITTSLPVNLESCQFCNVDYVQSFQYDSDLYCPKCGFECKDMDSSSMTMSYGEDIEFQTFSYKRVNHLKEWIIHYQCTKSKHLNDKPIIVAKVMEELRLEGVKKSEDITFRDVKKILKKLSLQKYSKMSMIIWTELTGRSQLKIDDLDLEKMFLMFYKIQIPFQKHCPPKRKNFLSYPYFLFKFSQFLGRDEYLPYFSLLKGPEKLCAQEETFAKICHDVGWIFIPIPPKYIPKM